MELPSEKRIVITVEDMNTEELYDILHIFDGSWEGSPTLARLSGVHHNRSFLSHSNVVMAEFSSDGGTNSTGFKALAEIAAGDSLIFYEGDTASSQILQK
ncbi:unnamed protein product [Strongylus vulgaris]|uniref:CUB domain-containing protein n=1 Tax=Strongylus vulgaris TaxID=40348 RepID=A0A3P7JLQ9_STRVU|nr:unnamed protein product [Strongylus vulgaris]